MACVRVGSDRVGRARLCQRGRPSMLLVAFLRIRANFGRQTDLRAIARVRNIRPRRGSSGGGGVDAAADVATAAAVLMFAFI